MYIHLSSCLCDEVTEMLFFFFFIVVSVASSTISEHTAGFIKGNYLWHYFLQQIVSSSFKSIEVHRYFLAFKNDYIIIGTEIAVKI